MDATMENKMGLPPPYHGAQYPAPPPAYFPSPPPPPPPVTQQPTAGSTPRTTVSSPAKLGPGPTGLTCPHCRAGVVTGVEYTPNNRTHIVASVLCLVAGCCCLCCVPYAMRSCKVANHYCPSCKAFIGSYYPS